jgi:hypothetical protein
MDPGSAADNAVPRFDSTTGNAAASSRAASSGQRSRGRAVGKRPIENAPRAVCNSRRLNYALLNHGMPPALEQPVVWFVTWALEQPVLCLVMHVAAWVRLLRNWNNFGGRAESMFHLLLSPAPLLPSVGRGLVLLAGANYKHQDAPRERRGVGGERLSLHSSSTGGARLASCLSLLSASAALLQSQLVCNCPAAARHGRPCGQHLGKTKIFMQRRGSLPRRFTCS